MEWIIVISMLLLSACNKPKEINSYVFNKPVYSIPNDQSLFDAVNRNDISAVRDLLEKGMDPNTPEGTYLPNPLIYSCTTGKFNMTNLLLYYGANPNQKFPSGFGPLEFSVMESRREITTLLLQWGTDPVKSSSWTLTMVAVAYGNLLEAERLIQSGSGVRGTDKSMLSPLTIASSLGYLNIAQMLVYHKADVNEHYGEYGYSPLMYAAMNGHVELVRFLIVNGADPKFTTPDGRSALSLTQNKLLNDISADKQSLEKIIGFLENLKISKN